MTRADAHPVELAALAVLALGWALMTVARLLLVPALALLLVALGWRIPSPVENLPSLRSATGVTPGDTPIALPEAPAPLPQAAALALTCAKTRRWLSLPRPSLDRLNVAELRRLARAAGLPRTLSRPAAVPS